jgi:hypothetical protein
MAMLIVLSISMRTNRFVYRFSSSSLVISHLPLLSQGKFQLLDGDKQIVLFTKFLAPLVKVCSSPVQPAFVPYRASLTFLSSGISL